MDPTVQIWSGREIRALREAQRMSIRDFATHLGISERMVSKWEAGGENLNPRPVNQAALDSSLAGSPPDAQARFAEFIGAAVATGGPDRMLPSPASGGNSAGHAQIPDSGISGNAGQVPGEVGLRVIETLRRSIDERIGGANIAGTGIDDGELAAIAANQSLQGPAKLNANYEIMTQRALSEESAWEVVDLVRRLGYSQVGANTIELLNETVSRLCCDYGREDAHILHRAVRAWISRTMTAMEARTTLAEHRELLVCAGWLFLLGGCLEYDMGWRAAADASRIAALQIGIETGHGEIRAWSWEMAAWFALTLGHVRDVRAFVDAGRQSGGTCSAIVQLDGQLAKAAARMGDSALVRGALESGYDKLGRSPRPDNPRHHFVVDPEKWDFYAMDAYRLLGDDASASAHANEVLRLGKAPNGAELAPMRMAEARLTLGVSAARSGELEEAVSVGSTAFSAERKSLPSLLMVASELKIELSSRYPREALVREYEDQLALVRRAARLEIPRGP
jgi:helix-turn-helix protein